MRLWRRAKDEIKYLDLRIARAKLTLIYNWWFWHEILNIKYEKVQYLISVIKYLIKKTLNAKYSDLNDALCQINPLIAPNVIVDCVDLVQPLDDEMNLIFGRELAFQSASDFFGFFITRGAGQSM